MKPIDQSYADLFDRLGYMFKDRELLKLALTHSSRRGGQKDYERLEFLGDRVLGLVIAEALYATEPAQTEGDMAPRLSALVRGEACATVARGIGLQEYVAVGQSEASKGINLAASVLGDVMEAVIAAVYLDGGLDAARALILRQWGGQLVHADTARKDAKTFLQEWSLARALGIPAYRVIGRAGPDHSPQFEAEVAIDGFDKASGSGTSKRIAEHNAAESFITRESLRA